MDVQMKNFVRPVYEISFQAIDFSIWIAEGIGTGVSFRKNKFRQVAVIRVFGGYFTLK
jgi:hypothetical protein